MSAAGARLLVLSFKDKICLGSSTASPCAEGKACVEQIAEILVVQSPGIKDLRPGCNNILSSDRKIHPRDEL